MGEVDAAVPVHNEERGHAAKLEQAYLLPVQSGHHVLRVSQSHKRHSLGFPVSPEALRSLWPNDDDLCPSVYELGVVAAQLRQVPAAERSGEAAVEYQHDVPPAPVVG
jgi:hypothetical protein